MNTIAKKRIALICLIGGLVIIATYFALRSMILGERLSNITETVVVEKMNTDIVAFTRLFVDKILRAEGEVDFETRLTLENAVRAMKDDEILAQWNRFVDSKSESTAQEEVKNLLSMLLSKMSE
ncbi:MAG: hypothetical protein WC648_04870 [Candidatus Paceibacterota bacterium]|jgi:hypothetical protein